MRYLFCQLCWKKRFISDYFKRSEKIPGDNDLLQMWVREEIMKGEIVFNNSVDTSSYKGNS